MGNYASKNPPTKLIFLDIDGVLNCVCSDVTQLEVVEEDLSIILSRLLQAIPGYALVLSSSWRYKEQTRAKLRQFFAAFGVPIYISCTPNFGRDRVDEILWWLATNSDYFEGKEGMCREILPVLSEEKSRFPEDLPESEYLLSKPLTGVTHFIAIDDMNLAKEKSRFVHLVTPYFVHVDKKFGLSEKNVEHAIQLLNHETV